MDLGRYNKGQLRNMSKGQLKDILREEWDACLNHDKLRWEFDHFFEMNKDLIIYILKKYFLEKSSIEISSTNPDNPYIGKINGFILDTSIKSNLETFERSILLLFLNGYLQKVQLVDVNQFGENSSFDESYYQAPTNSIPHEHNLLWIYKNHPDLFKIDVLANNDEFFLIENSAYFFKQDDSPKMILEKMIEYGRSVNIHCSLDSMLSLSHKGMYLIHLDQYYKNQNLLLEQEKILKEIENYKIEQISIINKLEETETKQDNILNEINKYKIEQLDVIEKITVNQSQINQIQSEMTKEFKKHKYKIDSFYKDIATILSILVAAFSFIGVNISAIPKIENNFTLNVIVLNLSLMLVIILLFFLLKNMVFSMPGENVRLGRSWTIYSAVSLIIIILLAVFSINYEPNSTTQKKVQDDLNTQVKSVYEQNKKINELNVKQYDTSEKLNSLIQDLQSLKKMVESENENK